MFQIAIYGKGGIGKSTVSANLSVALAKTGQRVLQIGCDPKHDSTRLLLRGQTPTTVLEYLRTVPEEKRRLDDILRTGSFDIKCVEAGGPEPGVGCAGRGILTTFEALKKLGLEEQSFDIKLYDVLGDVVCGGFAVPLRKDYADAVYIVTSGEFMSLYAANNILRGINNFDGNAKRVAGLILNGRGIEREDQTVSAYADAVGIPIVARIPRSELFIRSERKAVTLVELYHDSAPARILMDLANHVAKVSKDPSMLRKGTPLDDEDMNGLAMGHFEKLGSRRFLHFHSDAETGNKPVEGEGRKKRCTADRAVIHTCATNGAVNCASQVLDAAIIIHGPRSCGHLMSASMDYYALSSSKRNGTNPERTIGRRVVTTDMDDSMSIFGGVRKLESVIRDKVNEGWRTIFVVTTCASGIIGDNVAPVARRIEERCPDTTVKVVYADGNITGEFDQGYLDALAEVIDLADMNVQPEADMVNVVGERDFFIYNRDSSYKKAEELLGRLGLRVNCRLVSKTTTAAIKDLRKGALNIKAQNDQLSNRMAEKIREKSGIKTFDLPLPVGLSETERWMIELAKYTSCTEGVGKAIDELRSEYHSRLSRVRPNLEGKKVAVYLRFTQDVEWLLDLIQDVGARIQMIGLDRRLSSVAGELSLGKMESAKILQNLSVTETMAILESERPDLLLTDCRMSQTCPCHHDIVHRPDVGISSSIEMAERWSRIIRLPAVEEWKVEVRAC
ncbi:MAG: nitrogenase component 1 [Methanomassiliicoccus sp.]|nr:nitrogenase component 1 [Methanomassiliicoccus sp.]